MYHGLIHTVMIKSFKDPLTKDVFDGVVRKGFSADLIKIARRKLRFLHAAHMLADLRVPPGNRLEALKGDRAGKYSIRVNDQFRICFVWTSEGPKEVELTDYH
jgi:toxin HigB-1